MKADRIYGIDLGTTNSEIACLMDGKPVVVPVEHGERFLPSVVGVDREGKIVTGFAARNQEAAYPEDTVLSIKRKMGSGQSVVMAGKPYTPAEISSHILMTLKGAAERETGQAVRRVVITVPAYFTDLQRRDTVRAGELAGLEVVRIINEPTAAALAYGCRESRGEKVLVYDLGGGTFDISLMQIEQDVLEVLATDGDTMLGGDDFDALLVDRLIAAMPSGSVYPEDRRVRARLRATAERLKIALSRDTVRDVREEFIAIRDGAPVHLELSFTRRELEELIDEKLSRTFLLMDRVLEAAKVAEDEVSKVLLVGGSTYIPRILHVLAEERGFSVHREVDPTYAVAIGAAIQGAIIAGEPIGTILVDVNSHSLGISTLSLTLDGDMDDDRYSIVIHRNTPIPTSMSETFYTTVDDQKRVEVETFQGENPIASQNTFIGSFLLDLPRKLPEGSEIDVTFEYDLNGTVEVSARDRASGAKRAARYDVNRLADADSPLPEVVAKVAPKGMSRGQCERILKSARKKSNRFGLDSARAERIREQADLLENALAGGQADAADLAEDLAGLIAGI